MHSIETIHRLNAKAGNEARAKRIKPHLLKSIKDLTPQSVKYLGDACVDWDKKYKRLDTLFVDISGFGSPGELALTQDQLKQELARLIVENGPILIALEEVAQFQGYLAVWVKLPLDKSPPT